MAAYAALLSLGHVLDQLLQHPPRQKAVIGKAQIDSLLENISFLQEFLEDFSMIRGDEIQALELKIAASANAAELSIEGLVANQILPRKFSNIIHKIALKSQFCQDLRKVIKEMGSVKEEVMKIKETEGMKIMQQRRKATVSGSFLRDASDSKKTMVGFDEDLIQIMETLTGHQSDLRIISIVGMGGIGKTTLARNIYHNPLIMQHFHLHAWATISQQYSIHEILLALLKDFKVPVECRKQEQPADDELGEQLYKSLSGRKYLIVMDDVWNVECWNDIKRFFPDNKNGSRVMITTRLSNLADNLCSCSPHQLNFLDKDQCWTLFCDKVFGKESCPPELEGIGKTIVGNCRGLPLAIVTISGMLAKSHRTVEYWEDISNDTYAALHMGNDGLCFEILSLSYKHLPVFLKPCFLYTAIFPEDHKIRISRLVKLWVAEGILKPIRNRSLEEIAKDNLKDLIDRNLIQVHDYGSRNKIKTCIIHDLLRDLCLREAQKEQFLRVTMTDSLNNQCGIIEKRRQLNKKFRRATMMDSLINHCGIICKRRQHVFDASSFAKLHRLQRVVNMNNLCSFEETVRVVNAREIVFDDDQWFHYMLDMLGSLSLLRNLQSVTIPYGLMLVNLPAEIWEMPQLRHLKIGGGEFTLPDPPSTTNTNGKRDVFVLRNLQTLYRILNFRCTDEVVGRIPNLRKLGIDYYEFSRFCSRYSNHRELYNVAQFGNLESLFIFSDVNVMQHVCFPRSLKKLSLREGRVCWEDLRVVGSLPHLEVLKLKGVIGHEWSPVEGQFLQLKSLRIHGCICHKADNLEEWIADSSHFPRLVKLELGYLSNLKEIPYGIGEIQTLASISLVSCTDSANSSAKMIQEEQQDLGNEITVSIHPHNYGY